MTYSTLSAWRAAVKAAHPDHGGDPEQLMAVLSQRPDICHWGPCRKAIPKPSQNTKFCGDVCKIKWLAESRRRRKLPKRRVRKEKAPVQSVWAQWSQRYAERQR